jgi:CBS-domain-containing membrane protein
MTGVAAGISTRAVYAIEDGIEQLPIHWILRPAIKRMPRYVYADGTVRLAVDHMVNHDVGRLPVVERDRPAQVVGMITRSDVQRVYRQELKELRREKPNIALRLPRFPRKSSPASPPDAATNVASRIETEAQDASAGNRAGSA